MCGCDVCGAMCVGAMCEGVMCVGAMCVGAICVSAMWENTKNTHKHLENMMTGSANQMQRKLGKNITPFKHTLVYTCRM